MKKHGFQLIATLCIILTSIISGCERNYGSVPGPIQLSPEAKLTTEHDRIRTKFMAYLHFPYPARIISLEPPGKPSDEVVTITTTPEIQVTSIKSNDGKMVFQGAMSLHSKECQLPAGTYKIGARYFSKPEYDLHSQYVTQDFQKGHHYIFSYNYTENEKSRDGSSKWKLKVIEK